MLRTAQEIIDECFEKAKADATVKEIYIMAVNTARTEAILECVVSAQQNYNLSINKQSILDLIHQIK